MVLRFIIVECVSTWLVGYVCEVGKSVLIIVEYISVRMLWMYVCAGLASEMCCGSLIVWMCIIYI